MKSTLIFIFLMVLNTPCVFSQEGFRFLNQAEKKVRVSFKLINNLIVIPLTINGQNVSFILDTGSNKTILFSLPKSESVALKNVEKVMLQGLGNGESVEALLSKNNTISLQNFQSNHETIYVILKDYFDISSKMGVTIHGIIGYNLLKNSRIKINYTTKKIDFYASENFLKKRCRKCETFPLKIIRGKLFLEAKVQLDTIEDSLTPVNLLVDTGGSDALWLFENPQKNIQTPLKFFNDILGEGLSGTIYGNRSRIKKFQLGSFQMMSPTVSFLDSLTTVNAKVFSERNGSVGAGVLRRFTVWIDYPNRKLVLKKNSHFPKKFNYNMSGLDVVYDGKQLVREEETKIFRDAYNQSIDSNNSLSFITNYSYKFKPSFKIKNVLENSPAFDAGLQKEDIILSINGIATHNLTLGKITQKFQEKNGKKIKMIINRNGQELKFEFHLQQKI